MNRECHRRASIKLSITLSTKEKCCSVYGKLNPDLKALRISLGPASYGGSLPRIDDPGNLRRYVQETLLISFTPRLSRRRRRSRNVPPFMYPTFAAMSSTLALLVFKRCTARSTRRVWKYDIGDFPRTFCSLRVSVLLLAPTAFAALSRENLRASLARAQRSKRCTTGSECIR
jgi:hypothetical protein